MKHSLQLLVFLVARQVAHCCSDFLLNSSFGAGCMSGRTLDFETDLGSEIGYVHPGATLTLLPICKGSPPAKLKTEHAFAFMASARSVFQSIHSVRPSLCLGFCYTLCARPLSEAGFRKLVLCLIVSAGSWLGA